MSDYFNEPVSSMQPGRIAGFTLLVALAVLAGCAEKSLTCSDESTVGVVKKIYGEAMTSGLLAGADAAAYRAQVESVTSVELRSIRTVGKDEKIGVLSCEGSLSVRVPAKSANALSTPGTPLSMAVQSVAIAVNGDRLEKDIQYTSQMTDDGKQVRVLAKGVSEVGELISMLVATGMIETKSTVAAAPAVPATPSAIPEAKSVSASAPPEGSKITEEKNTPVREGSVVAEPAVAAAAPVAIGPSFSCASKLTSAEKLICDTPSLAQADSQLAKQYKVAQTKVPDVAALKQEQRGWQQIRDACADVACMESAYAKRLAELQR